MGKLKIDSDWLVVDYNQPNYLYHCKHSEYVSELREILKTRYESWKLGWQVLKNHKWIQFSERLRLLIKSIYLLFLVNFTMNDEDSINA